MIGRARRHPDISRIPAPAHVASHRPRPSVLRWDSRRPLAGATLAERERLTGNFGRAPLQPFEGRFQPSSGGSNRWCPCFGPVAGASRAPLIALIASPSFLVARSAASSQVLAI